MFVINFCKRVVRHLPFYELYCMGGVKIIGANKLCLLRQLHVRGKNNVIELHSRLPKGVQIYIYGNGNHLRIGEGVTFKKGVIWFEDDGGSIDIGAGTTIENAQLAVAENGRKLVIGNDCMISSNVRIATTDSHSVIDLSTNKRTNYGADVVVGNHVWIGYNVSVNKGCTVEDDCVIAGNSVVTKNVPHNVIVAGVPAKVVKEGVTWDRTRIQ